ncbi:hypothetical protein ALT1000_320004 [Alteromonas macleodii]
MVSTTEYAGGIRFNGVGRKSESRSYFATTRKHAKSRGNAKSAP